MKKDFKYFYTLVNKEEVNSSFNDFKKDATLWFTPQDWNTKEPKGFGWTYDSRIKRDIIGKPIKIMDYAPSKKVLDYYREENFDIASEFLGFFESALGELKDKYPEFYFKSSKNVAKKETTAFLGLEIRNRIYQKYLQVKIPKPKDYNTYSDRDIDFIEQQFAKDKIWFEPTSKLIAFAKDVDKVLKILKSDLFWIKHLRDLVEDRNKLRKRGY